MTIELKKLKEEITGEGGEAVFVFVDVTHEEDVQKIAEKAIEPFWGIRHQGDYAPAFDSSNRRRSWPGRPGTGEKQREFQKAPDHQTFPKSHCVLRTVTAQD